MSSLEKTLAQQKLAVSLLRKIQGSAQILLHFSHSITVALLMLLVTYFTCVCAQYCITETYHTVEDDSTYGTELKCQ